MGDDTQSRACGCRLHHRYGVQIVVDDHDMLDVAFEVLVVDRGQCAAEQFGPVAGDRHDTDGVSRHHADSGTPIVDNPPQAMLTSSCRLPLRLKKMAMSWSHSALVAEVYDIAQPLGRTVGDVEFYLRAVADVDGRILEPACGTGRVLIPLLDVGHAADGADHSPDMLEICRQHCRERGLDPRLYVADMSTFVQPETYDAVVVPRGSIRNLAGREMTIRALDCFHTSLTPGGRLLLDVTIPLFVPDPLPIVEHWVRDPYVYTCETLVIDYDPFLDRTMRYARYTKWCDGEFVTTELHRFTFQHWNLHQFEALLAERGYVDITVTGDFSDDAPREGNRYWNFSARKPG
jgi:SAM-dependent methyltransferase